MKIETIIQIITGTFFSGVVALVFWYIKKAFDKDLKDLKNDVGQITEKITALNLNISEWKREIIEVHVRNLESKIADNKNEIVGIKADVKNLKNK